MFIATKKGILKIKYNIIYTVPHMYILHVLQILICIENPTAYIRQWVQ